MRNKKPKTDPQPSSRVMVDRDALARLAYELYARRGGEDGHDLEDWVMAEKILLMQNTRAALRSEPKESRRLEDRF